MILQERYRNIQETHDQSHSTASPQPFEDICLSNKFTHSCISEQETELVPELWDTPRSIGPPSTPRARQCQNLQVIIHIRNTKQADHSV